VADGGYGSRFVHPGKHVLQIVGPAILPRTVPFELQPGQTLESQIEVASALACTLAISFEEASKTIYGELRVEDESGLLVLVERLHKDLKVSNDASLELLRGLPQGSFRAVFTDWTSGKTKQSEVEVPATGGRIELRF
jgi:hypothetical protein